jgi:hypothetical protein
MKNKVLIRPLPSFFDLLEQKRRRWARGGKYTGKNMLFLLPNRNRNILFLLEGWYHEQRNGWCIIVIGSSIQTQIDYLSWHVKWMTPWHHHAVSKKTRTEKAVFVTLCRSCCFEQYRTRRARREKMAVGQARSFRKVAVGVITISVECSQSKLATTFLLFVSSFLHLSFP